MAAVEAGMEAAFGEPGLLMREMHEMADLEVGGTCAADAARVSVTPFDPMLRS